MGTFNLRVKQMQPEVGLILRDRLEIGSKIPLSKEQSLPADVGETVIFLRLVKGNMFVH